MFDLGDCQAHCFLSSCTAFCFWKCGAAQELRHWLLCNRPLQAQTRTAWHVVMLAPWANTAVLRLAVW